VDHRLVKNFGASESKARTRFNACSDERTDFFTGIVVVVVSGLLFAALLLECCSCWTAPRTLVFLFAGPLSLRAVVSTA
jgi:hypothetical protein